MPDIASALKSEISRIARKEIRGEVQSLKKAVSTYRTEIAALKRQAQALEQSLQRLAKSSPQVAPTRPSEESSRAIRFSAKRLAAQRKRLGLSAEQLGRLLNTSSQSVYNWEAGTVRPRATYLPAIAALRTLGKKQAAAVLASIGSST